jgi:hypothetical protein
MIITFTPNDVIRYFYNETSQTENKELEKALLLDSDLMEVYEQLLNLGGLMNKIHEEPSQKVVDNILNYSKSQNLDSVTNR